MFGVANKTRLLVLLCVLFTTAGLAQTVHTFPSGIRCGRTAPGEYFFQDNQHVATTRIGSPFLYEMVFKAGDDSDGFWQHPYTAGNLPNITHDDHEPVFDACAVDFNVKKTLSSHEKPFASSDLDNGIPVLSVGDGKIDQIVWNRGGYGFYIIVKHSQTTRSRYAHLMVSPSRSPWLKKGDLVRKGDIIGYLGTTGESTSPHLHFSLEYNFGSETVPIWKSVDFGYMDDQAVNSGAELVSRNGAVVNNTAVRFPDYTVIKNAQTEDVYMAMGGKLSVFERWEHYLSWETYHAQEPLLVSPSVIATYPKSSQVMSFRPGTLLRETQDFTNTSVYAGWYGKTYVVVYHEGKAYKKEILEGEFNAMGMFHSHVLRVPAALLADSVLPNGGNIIKGFTPGGALLLYAECSPKEVTLIEGQSQQFSLSVTGGTPPYNYKWSVFGANPSSGTGSSFTTTFPKMGNYTLFADVTDSGNVGEGLQQTAIAFCSAIANGPVLPSGPKEFSELPLAQDSSLISYFRLEDLVDTKGHHLTNFGGAAFVPAKFGKGVDLGANNSTKHLANSHNPSSYAFLNGFTYNLWYKPPFAPTGGARWELGGAFSDTDRVNIRIDYYDDGGVPKIWFNYEINGQKGIPVVYPTILPASAFTMLTITYNGSTVRGYVNGSEVGSVAASGKGHGVYEASGLSVGAAVHGGHRASGILDDVTAFSRPLNASEIAVIYGDGSPSTPTTPTPTPSFNFTAASSSKSVQAGNQTGFDLSISSVNNFSGIVTIFTAGLPFNTTVVNPSTQFSVSPTSGANFTLTLQTAGNTPAGTYPITLTAQGGGLQKTLNLSLNVSAAPQGPLSVSCSVSPNPINLGQGTTVFITATGGSGGYQYSVNGSAFQASSSTVVMPNDAGIFSLAAVAKDSSGATASTNCSFTVNGIAPIISGFAWDTQPIGGQKFSGTLSGGYFTPNTTVWFFGPGCSNGCQHPSAGVAVLGLITIRLTNVQLNSGSWQVEVRTAFGSSRSSSFAVN